MTLFLLSMTPGTVPAGEEVQKDGPTPIETVITKSLGNRVKILRIDAPEPSPVQGWKQIRVWFESVYGETPVLFYVTEDGTHYIAGSIFDAEGNNLTRRDVGETKPRVITESEMELDSAYRIGPEEALVTAVLWIGTDRVSVTMFETLYELYEKNSDTVSLHIKFHPSANPQDMTRTIALSCFKRDIREGFSFLSNAAPSWGQHKKDIDAFKKKNGFNDCDGTVVTEHIALAKKLRIPAHQVVVINGGFLLEDVTKENIVKASGVELR
jgi:hypothetical protein